MTKLKEIPPRIIPEIIKYKWPQPDPAPDRIFDRIKLKQFYKMEAQFRIQELQIEMERMKALEKLLG